MHNAPMAKRINVNLDKLMAARGLNLHQLSKRSGVNYRTLTRLRSEMKQIPLLVLARLCETLECRPGDILELTEDAGHTPANQK